PPLGGTDAEADKDELTCCLSLSRRAEVHGNKPLAGAEYGTPIDKNLQAVGRAEGRRREVEALEVRPVGPEALEAEPLEARGDERGGQVILGGPGQSAAEPITRQEE